MENALLEASISGDVDTLQKLIQNDPLILDRVLATSFNENPLHKAALRGHVDFVRILLRHKRELANALDDFRRSPLHLASGGGYTDIVRELIMINPEMCRICDRDGKIPLHFAAYGEHVYIMDVLIQAKPEQVKAIFDNNETLLHFCVKHNRIEALKVLVKWLGRDICDRAFVNAKDNRGNTILHLAVIEKQMQTVSYLLSEGGIDGNARTKNGFTALDLVELFPSDFDTMKIREILTGANIKRANDLIGTSPPSSSEIIPLNTTGQLSSSQICSGRVKRFIKMIWKEFLKTEPRWFEEARGNLLVAATVIASMAFQAAINPPGGFWQEESESHRAGYSIAATDLQYTYKWFFIYITTSFLASLSTVLLIIGGFPLKHKVTTWLLTMMICLAIASMLQAYLQSILLITSDNETLGTAIKVTIIVIYAIIALVLFLQTMRFLVWIGKQLRKFFCTKRSGENSGTLP